MLGKSLAILVVSPRDRSGTTLIARLFAEFFRLSGDAPLLFDTDTLKPKFSKYFPEAQVVNLDKTKGQMGLCVRMSRRSSMSRAARLRLFSR
jgi:hypothetical protein